MKRYVKYVSAAVAKQPVAVNMFELPAWDIFTYDRERGRELTVDPAFLCRRLNPKHKLGGRRLEAGSGFWKNEL